MPAAPPSLLQHTKLRPTTPAAPPSLLLCAARQPPLRLRPLLLPLSPHRSLPLFPRRRPLLPLFSASSAGRLCTRRSTPPYLLAPPAAPPSLPAPPAAPSLRGGMESISRQPTRRRVWWRW